MDARRRFGKNGKARSFLLLRFFMKQPFALIFDLDDTLAETGENWKNAERSLLRALDAEVEEMSLDRFNGCATREIVAQVHNELKPSLSIERCEALLEEALLAGVGRGELCLKPGALTLIDRVGSLASLAIASGSPVAVIRRVLARWNLLDRFDCVVSSTEVAEGKPSPLVFQEAARRLGMAPQRCIVIEDSLVGVRAAKAAGMICFAVPSLDVQAGAIADQADQVFTRLDEIEEAHFLDSLSRV